jgi:hypothetical protein
MDMCCCLVCLVHVNNGLVFAGQGGVRLDLEYEAVRGRF